MTLQDEARAFRRTPPHAFAAPNDLVRLVQTQSRSEYILSHGFSRQEIKPEWWAARDIRLEFPSAHDNEAKLTRRDLFAMADEVHARAGDGLLELLWHVLAWGSGESRRNNLRRIAGCRANVPLLRGAFNAARAGQLREAYSALIRPGRAAIPWLGPAFFSKFLYFASGEAVPSCLILDARVARSMFSCGWSMAPTYPTATFSYNWFTDTYVGYCQMLADWAEQAGAGVTPDMFERALFEAGKG